MKLAVDLHVHSCLSPCGDLLMTPNNIINMAYIKELDVIAVSDHNSAENLPACFAIARERGVVLLPAIEVTTAEEVHVLAYFETVETALKTGRELRGYLPSIPNTPAIFGDQLVLDEDDEVIGTEDKLLISATSLSIDELCVFIENAGGICVPAHINRGSSGLLVGLGFLPADAPYAILEVSRKAPAPICDLTGYKILYSSDAHYIEDISEREFYLEVPEKSAEAVFHTLKSYRRQN